VLFSHFVQVIVPFGLFAPQPFASVAGGLIIFHQLWLIISGNYSWLNWLTVALGITAFSDSVLSFIPIANLQTAAEPLWFVVLMYVIAAGVVALSVQPALNLISSRQIMNYSYNRFHLVNTYGAFGNVTKRRHEIVVEGTDEVLLTERTRWQEYEFKAKPGRPGRMPPQIAPYHLRLDWLMWFLPFSVMVNEEQIFVPGYEIWFMRMVQKLLENDSLTLKLFKTNPFLQANPRFIRALFYEYHFTGWKQKSESGDWWTRRLIAVYLPPISLDHLKRL
jgi:hypothetical protein